MSVTLKNKNNSVQDDLHPIHEPTPHGARELAIIKSEVNDILEHIKDVVFQTNINFNFTYLNEAWYALTGFSVAESIEQPLGYFIVGETHDNFYAEFERAIVQRKAISLEVQLVNNYQEEIIGELFIKPIYNRYGALIGTLGTIKDITTQKKELETLQTLYHALQKSDKEAQKLNLELETFMYKASHDLLGPLASIHGLLVLAKSQKNSKETNEYLGMMTQSANQLMVTLENLLEITKIKQGKPQIASVNFEEIVGEIIDYFSRNPDFNKIEFESKIDAKYPFYSDRNLLYNILFRLVENAFNYRRTNIIPFIHISIVGDLQKVIIRVDDNGQGIIEEVQEKIFDMFFKGTELNHGSGLGLYIVKNALDKLNGTIKVQSLERRGSAFTVVVPNIL